MQREPFTKIDDKVGDRFLNTGADYLSGADGCNDRISGIDGLRQPELLFVIFGSYPNLFGVDQSPERLRSNRAVIAETEKPRVIHFLARNQALLPKPFDFFRHVFRRSARAPIENQTPMVVKVSVRRLPHGLPHEMGQNGRLQSHADAG